jgi:hypothetical protein
LTEDVKPRINAAAASARKPLVSVAVRGGSFGRMWRRKTPASSARCEGKETLHPKAREKKLLLKKI